MHAATTTSQSGSFDAAAFRNLVGHFPSGVTVVAVSEGDNQYGATASAFCSLSLDPPMVLVCLHSEIETARAIARVKRFSLSILGETQSDIALRFAAKTPDKFKDVSSVEILNGHPAISNAIAQLSCEVTDIAVGGTHNVFLSKVLSYRINSNLPLAYFRGGFGKFVSHSGN